MARQIFVREQTVYVKRSYSGWGKAVVRDPDVTSMSMGMRGAARDIHYVKVANYIDGKPSKREYTVLNRRDLIVDETRYAEIDRADTITELRRTVDAEGIRAALRYTYRAEAKSLLDTMPLNYALADDDPIIERVAEHLRTHFRLLRAWEQKSVERLRRDEAEEIAGSEAAREELKRLGATITPTAEEEAES